MNVFFITLGCKVNQYESQAMLETLVNAGFSIAENRESADVVIINSCTVTSASDHKVRQMMHRSRRENPLSIIILTGCMPQAFPDVAARFEDADIILGNSNRAALLPSITRFLTDRKKIIDIKPYTAKDSFEKMAVTGFHERTRAFIKIEDGCNRFCSYCIIPYARGRVRSKPLEELQKEISSLAEAGYREVILTGINLSAYGQDIGKHLCDAIEAACATDGIERVRLGSLEPEQMDKQVIARLALQKKLCPQFHLSLQSGCDATLQRMNRHYNTAEYYEIVQNLRQAFTNASITTDVMVGFAGEDEDEFAASLAFVKKVGFAKVHVFPYSQRAGTRAADAPNQVSPTVKEQRSHSMALLAAQNREQFLQSQAGLVEAVLFEAAHDSYYEGYTMNYTPVRVKSDTNISGKILDVKITQAKKDWCEGSIISRIL